MLLALALTALLVGCAKDDVKGVETAQGGGLPIEKGDATGQTQPLETPSPVAEKMDKVAAAMKEEQDKNLSIKSNLELGYSPTTTSASQNIGNLVDDAIVKGGSTWVKSRIEMTIDGNMTSSTPETKYQDRSHYLIQYIDPDVPDEVGRVVKNGGAAVQLKGGKFVKANEKTPELKFGKSEVYSWFKKAPYRVFDGYRTGAGTMGALVTALKDKSLGFDTEVSEKTMTVNGKERKFYRIVSTDKSGFESEIVVDTLRNVPVTIRASVPSDSSENFKVLWTAQWQFDGQFDKKEFVHPPVK